MYQFAETTTLEGSDTDRTYDIFNRDMFLRAVVTSHKKADEDAAETADDRQDT